MSNREKHRKSIRSIFNEGIGGMFGKRTAPKDRNVNSREARQVATRIRPDLGNVSNQILNLVDSESWEGYEQPPAFDFASFENEPAVRQTNSLQQRKRSCIVDKSAERNYRKASGYVDVLTSYAPQELNESETGSSVAGLKVRESSPSFWRNTDVIVDRLCMRAMSNSSPRKEAQVLERIGRIYAQHGKGEHFIKLVRAYSDHSDQVESILRKRLHL